MARQRKIDFLRVVPRPSILNGDVLAISRNSKSVAAANSFIAYVTSYEQSRLLCSMVSDAGFPADIDKAMLDTLFNVDPLQKGFLETIKVSRPLPLHKNMLSIEPIIEDMIVRCYAAKSKDEVVEIVQLARNQIELFEH
jgi:maltose-binding protein MalE